MEGFEQEGPDDGAQPMTSDADQDDRARLIGEIVEAFVLGLGHNQAIMPSALVEFVPAAHGRRQPGLPRGTGRNALGISGVDDHAASSGGRA